MRKIYLAILILISLASQAQKPVDPLEIGKYVDSINILLQTWTNHDPVLLVDTSGKTTILHKDGSRFVFDMRKLSGNSEDGGKQFHGVELSLYDPRTRPAEQHFINFNGSGISGGLIRFDKIPANELHHIYELFVSLRRLFL